MARAAGKALVVVGLARTASTLAAGPAVAMAAQLVAGQLAVIVPVEILDDVAKADRELLDRDAAVSVRVVGLKLAHHGACELVGRRRLRDIARAVHFYRVAPSALWG